MNSSTQSNLHVHNNDRSLFVGIEREGIHQGDKTLFVKGLFAYIDILDAYKAYNCVRIYFGAGRLSSFSTLVVNKFISAGFSVTVESFDIERLETLIDEQNLTIHYTIAMPEIKVEQFRLLKHQAAKLFYKIDIGTQCLFFDKPPFNQNSFDGYPEDEIIYYEKQKH